MAWKPNTNISQGSNKSVAVQDVSHGDYHATTSMGTLWKTSGDRYFASVQTEQGHPEDPDVVRYDESRSFRTLERARIAGDVYLKRHLYGGDNPPRGR